VIVPRIFRKAVRSIQRRAVKLVLPNPRAGHGEYSMIYDTLNTWGGPSNYLIDLALHAAQEAWHTELPDLSRRSIPTAMISPEFGRANTTDCCRSGKIVATENAFSKSGHFAECRRLRLKNSCRSPAKSPPSTLFPGIGVDTFLRPEDFEDDRLQQQIGDLSDAAAFELHRSLIQETELLFVDGPKDGVFERKLLRNWRR